MLKMNFNFNFTRIACTLQGRQRVRSRADVTWVTCKFLTQELLKAAG